MITILAIPLRSSNVRMTLSASNGCQTGFTSIPIPPVGSQSNGIDNSTKYDHFCARYEPNNQVQFYGVRVNGWAYSGLAVHPGAWLRIEIGVAVDPAAMHRLSPDPITKRVRLIVRGFVYAPGILTPVAETHAPTWRNNVVFGCGCIVPSGPVPPPAPKLGVGFFDLHSAPTAASLILFNRTSVSPEAALAGEHM